MGWRSLYISKPAKVSFRDNRLVINQEEEFSIPLEDVDSIVVDSGEVSSTFVLMSKLAEYGISLFTCDEKHIPNGILIPFHQHSRQNKVTATQIESSQPFKKRCWQRVIQKKILNQSLCLEYAGLKDYMEIRALAHYVTSGDASQKESHASRLYFSRLLEGITRRKQHILNSGLNYGYSIFRGTIARTLSSYGFIPCLGIHHDSELNSFNLADDFIEVFRPLVDLWVIMNIPRDKEDLTLEQRVGLVNLLHYDMAMVDGHYPALMSIEKMIGSYSTAMFEKDASRLELPQLIPLEKHQYE